MEIKDWILLTIPIACNGVILFIFQQVYLSRLKKGERKNTYKIDVLKEFLSNLQRFYELLRNIQKVDNERTAKEYTFAELWNPATEMIQTLIVFVDTHPITINKSHLGFDKCIDKWQEITDMLFECARNNNGIMSDECNFRFSNAYIEMNDLIKDCMGNCEKQIID